MTQRITKSQAGVTASAFVLGVAVTLVGQRLIRDREHNPLPERTRLTEVQNFRMGARGQFPREAESSNLPTKVAANATRDENRSESEPGSRGRWLDHLVERERQIETIGIDTQLALWADRMGLSASQETALRNMMEQHLEDRLMTMGRNGGKALASAQQRELENLLGGTLSETQKEAYARLQETQQWNEIDSRAMRRVADIQLQLDLSEIQRDRLLEVFHAREITRAENPPATRGGYQDFIDSGGTHEEWRGKREEMARLEREEELDLAREILSERQLLAYRAYLGRRGSGYDPVRPRTSAVAPLIPGR